MGLLRGRAEKRRRRHEPDPELPFLTVGQADSLLLGARIYSLGLGQPATIEGRSLVLQDGRRLDMYALARQLSLVPEKEWTAVIAADLDRRLAPGAQDGPA